MIGRWQQKILAQYIGNFLANQAVSKAWQKSLIQHIAENSLLGEAASRQCKKLLSGADEFCNHGKGRKRMSSGYGKVRTILERASHQLSAKLARVRPDSIEINIKTLAKVFELDAMGLAILRLHLLPMMIRPFMELVDCIQLSRYGNDNFHSFAAVLLNCNETEVQRYAGIGGILQERGLIDLSRDYSKHFDFTDFYNISWRVCAAISPPEKSSEAMMQIILGKSAPPSLQWTDFDHLGERRDRLRRLLQAAMQQHEPGVNILLYGPPGTGKTEFARALADAVGASIYSAGESKEQDRWRGHDPDRFDRLLDLRLTQQMLARNQTALILFDEMEDIVERVSPFLRQVGSRIYLHRLLEKNQTPTIWTSNDVAGLPEPVLRRMTMAIEVRPPSAVVRRRVWKRILDRHDVTADESLIHRLAAEFEAAPGLAEQAVRACKLSGESPESLPDFVQGLAKAVRGGREMPPKAASNLGRFDPRLANTGIDPEDLLKRLSGTGLGAYSLCLSGPPGTGKTAFAAELADRLGVPVLRKRASDLLSKWLGGSERNIADAFAEARDNHAILVIDEADSLLADRQGATRSWEVTQVNEMLTWMEVHPLPFVCTTNLPDRLDAASLRRFTFKLEMGYMRREQVALLFHQVFGLQAPGTALDLDCLTPGDFAVVKRKAGLLGRLEDAADLADLLGAEVAAKTGKRPVFGFAIRT